MDLVVFDLDTNGQTLSPNTSFISALAAVRLRAGSLEELGRFETLILTPPPLSSGVDKEALRNAPLVQDALKHFSDFVGNAWLVSEYAPAEKMPHLYEACFRYGLPTREVSVLDIHDLARQLWHDDASSGFHELMQRLRTEQEDPAGSWLMKRVLYHVQAVTAMREALTTTTLAMTCTGRLPA
jgi:DNA polymerase III alpha subunit (gram-positive type)